MNPSASSFSPGGRGGGGGYGYYEGYGEYYNDNESSYYESSAAISVQPGAYYELPSLGPSMLPISAISYDSMYDAIYTATVTTATPSRKRERASMMKVLSQNGIYSSVFNHPEAPPKILNIIYDAMYGQLDDSKPTKAPNHAYQPVYGKNVPALPDALIDTLVTNSQLGTTKLVNFQQGHIASVSPAAVRVHTMGGLQIADEHTEGMLSIAPSADSASVTHLIAGGAQTDKPQMHSLDLWQGLRIVSSHLLNPHIVITAMEYSSNRHCVVAGGTDGNLHLVDNRVRRTIHTIKSHAGGVVDIAVSDMLVATTGYGSIKRSRTRTSLFAFPDPNILINDLRYMGRGGFPHSFAGLRGGPRFAKFLPNFQDTTRLLVASGQVGGGCQIVVPFEESKSTQFIVPSNMDRGESITAVCVSEDKLALGTSRGKVLQYKMAGYEVKPKTQRGVFVPSSVGKESAREKQPLVMPPYQPPVPKISLDARILLNEETKGDESIFGAFILAAEPTVSMVGDPLHSTFGPLVSQPLIDQSKLEVSAQLLKKAAHTIDFVQTIPTSELEIDILEDHRPKRQQSRLKKNGSQANPNKFIYTNTLFKMAYAESLNRSKRHGKQSRRRNEQSDSDDEGDLIEVPKRYQLKLRPSHRLASFNYAEYNQTGLFPGFDHPTTKQNAFVAPVLSLLYFIPEIREAALKSQLGGNPSSAREHSLLAELGCLFYRIENMAKRALLFPAGEGASTMASLHAWAPSSLISYLASMTEAERFQILDGSPAAVDSQRRPEAFYRFLMYHLDNNIGVLDALGGMDFVSINEFISGSSPPSKSTTKHLTVELSYNYFFGPDFQSDTKPSFGDVLQHNLSRETRLRAWNGASKSYETIVQRKIATSLPSILSLSAACAGRKEEEGLALWRGHDSNGHWLPEFIEVEIEENGTVVVREQVLDEKGSKTWKECRGSGSLPDAVSDVVVENTMSGLARRRQYRLEAVVSLVRDDLDRACPEEVRAADAQVGHHVLHVRVSNAAKKRILQQQKVELKRYLASDTVEDVTSMTVLGLGASEATLKKRSEYVEDKLKELEKDDASDNDWILVNGFVVSKTFIEDAQAFHVKFKEPSLIVYRVVSEGDSTPKATKKKPKILENLDVKVPPDVIRTSSITNGSRSPYAGSQKTTLLPGAGDLIAFDAEFVAVEEEDSILTNSGSKLIICETRHALARISVIDGRPTSAGSVIFDDHVVPTEPVTDYLTRFSGIVKQDLDPKNSRHHLIYARSAYLKLRCLLERGCIFVGHGLHQDFWTANLDVAPWQIIDTVEIYHKPAQRYISLRFLTNFVLQRDMQQDVHDSLEDALAAYELYRKAVELKKEGKFEKLLDKLYEYGQKTDWKLGMDEQLS